MCSTVNKRFRKVRSKIDAIYVTMSARRLSLEKFMSECYCYTVFGSDCRFTVACLIAGNLRFWLTTLKFHVLLERLCSLKCILWSLNDVRVSRRDRATRKTALFRSFWDHRMIVRMLFVFCAGCGRFVLPHNDVLIHVVEKSCFSWFSQPRYA